MIAPLSETPVERVLARLKGVKPVSSNAWMAKCPAHDDKQASLSIKEGDERRAVLFCHAQCTTKNIVAALGLAWGDLFIGGRPPLEVSSSVVAPAQGVTARPKLIKSYDYRDADGTLLFQTCRLEPKSFRQRRREGEGWAWNLKGVTPVLYRLPEIIEAVALNQQILIAEGEKDADALTALGFQATTSPMGAGKWREPYAEVLAGASVVIVPDNDDAGRTHAHQVAASLTMRKCAVRVVELPNLPPKGDISDWLAAGGERDALASIIDRTPVWGVDAMTDKHRTRWRLDELYADDELMSPPPPVVPYLAWRGRSTLLAAREKSGKSTLTGYMSSMVSNGGMFLDEPCEQGNVLIVGLEEFIGDCGRRLLDFDADAKRVYIVDRLMSEDRPGELRAHIEAVSPSLVILDSLMAYSQGVITDANNSTQTQSTVQALTNIAHTCGVALVIIHHARKADGKYRDSSAIGGAVDIIAEVFPPDENGEPTRRRVRPIGRVPSRAVDFSFDGQRYVRLDASSSPSKAPIEQRILDVVRERPGISANDVADAVHENRKTCLERIRFMLNRQQLINDGNSSFYRLRLPTYPQSP